MEVNKKTKNIVLIMVGISVFFIILVVLAFVMFFQEQRKNVKQEVKTSIISMNYKSNTNSLTLTDLTPMSDEKGKVLRKEGSYFDFTISSKLEDDTSIKYEIALIKDKSSTISDDDIMVYLEKQNSGTYAKVDEPKVFTPIKKKSKLGSPAKSMVLNRVSQSSSQVDNYRLRIWVREGATIQNSNATYMLKVNVYAKAD
ncbi:MAG TPA: hypothetical protein IAB35_00865 [Candidatus Faecimonas gallistercoris]|nr:hypothetical protein [Candidatus Faecimonas gallistercoris]